MGVDHIVDIFWRQATRSQALNHIRICGKRLSRVDMSLDWLWVTLYVPSDAQIENDACRLSCIRVFMLDEEGEGWYSPPSRIGSWMHEEPLRERQMTCREGVDLNCDLVLRRSWRCAVA